MVDLNEALLKCVEIKFGFVGKVGSPQSTAKIESRQGGVYLLGNGVGNRDAAAVLREQNFSIENLGAHIQMDAGNFCALMLLYFSDD